MRTVIDFVTIVAGLLAVWGAFMIIASGSGWSHDGYPLSCCSNSDCAPAYFGPVQLQEGPYKGFWEVHTEQARMIFKPDTVLQTFKKGGKPMAGVHACFYNYLSGPPEMPGYRFGRCLHIGSGT